MFHKNHLNSDIKILNGPYEPGSICCFIIISTDEAIFTGLLNNRFIGFWNATT